MTSRSSTRGASRSRRKKVRDIDRMRSTIYSPVSVFFLLLNFFFIAWLRSTDKLILAFITAIVSAIGFYIGRRAMRKIRHHHGVIQGYGAASIGMYGNLSILALSFAFLCWEIARSIISGDLDFI